MRNFKLLFITTFSLLFLVAGVKPIDQQYTGEINILSNPGFENGLDDWDESDGTFSRESSEVYLGTTSSKWDSDGSGQFLDSDAVTIPKALQGKLCILEFNYKGGDAGLKFGAYDGSAYVGEVPTKDLVASTEWVWAYNTFVCPNSGTLQVRLESTTADPAIVYLDQFFMGVKEIKAAIDPRWPSYDKDEVTLSGYTIESANLIPYQDAQGNWYLRFNIAVTGTGTSANLIVELANTNVSPDGQAITFFDSTVGGRAADQFSQAYAVNNSTALRFRANFSSTIALALSYFSGDIALASKPTFATKTAPDVYLAGSVSSDQVVAKAYKSSNQSIGDGATDIVDFDTVTDDSDAGITTGASWKYTAKESGWFLVSTSIRFSTASWNAGDIIVTYFYKNGVSYNRFDSIEAQSSDNAASQSVTIKGVQIIPLAVGDYIDVRLTNNTGATSTIDGAGVPYTYIDIAKIPSPLDVANVALTFSTATADRPGLVIKGVAVPDASGATPTKAEFDALLDSLRDAGIITP